MPRKREILRIVNNNHTQMHQSITLERATAILNLFVADETNAGIRELSFDKIMKTTLTAHQQQQQNTVVQMSIHACQQRQ